MALLPVGETWGIGRKLTEKLQTMGIKTVLQLADANLQLMKKTFGVVIERTIRELNGTACISIDALPAKQQIICSRGFGERITQLHDTRQTVCQYAESGAEKLLQERQYCRDVSVFLRTSPYANEPQYGINATQQLMLATQDTRDIVAAAMKALDSILQLLRRKRLHVNHKRVYQLNHLSGLGVKRRRRRKGLATERLPLNRKAAPNLTW